MNLRDEDLLNQPTTEDNALQKLVALTDKTQHVQRSKLDKYFWVFVLTGIFGVPLITIGLLWGLATLVGSPRNLQDMITVSEIQLDGPVNLCPGETLDFRFSVEILREGVYEAEISTWQMAPLPPTIVENETQRFGSAREVKYEIQRSWTVKHYAPGVYERQILVRAVDSNLKPLVRIVSFEIREDCPV